MKEHLIFAAMSPFMIVVCICAGIVMIITYGFLLIGERVSKAESRLDGEYPG
jgi:hypothetical protein